MSRRWTFPTEWTWVLSLLLVASFFVPTETVGGHAVQVTLQGAFMLGVMAWVVSSVPSAARRWVAVVLSVLAVLLLFIGGRMVYHHWQNAQVQQSVN